MKQNDTLGFKQFLKYDSIARFKLVLGISLSYYQNKL